MFKKFKKQFKRFMTGKSGFSLVELIVVIAIMAVMAAVLAPALLGYVERSRAQKDDSAFDEVVNSVQLSLADQDVYDEMLKYSAEQYSCYIDSDSPDEANKVELKAGKYFMYNDNERQLDETVYKLDGVMRGVTITFAPDAAASNSATLDLIKGHVNKYLPSGKKTYGGLTGANASPQLSEIADSELYNSLRATIGDKIAISSQTYRNSEYTIFIAMGTTGGNQADMQDAIKVWGQWSGTNLPEGSSVATNGATSGTSAGSNEFQGVNVPVEPTVDPALNPAGILPSGAIYYSQYTYNEGDAFPTTTVNADEYQYDGYTYVYRDAFNGWQVTQVADTSKKSYSAVLESINGKPVVMMIGTFKNCTQMEVAPVIPNSVNTLSSTFFGCTSLKATPVIPEGVKILSQTFSGCTSLETVSSIPSTVQEMTLTFYNCTSIKGTIVINTNNINHTGYQSGSCQSCFYGVNMSNVTLTGSATKDVLNLIGSTGNNWTNIL